MPLADAHKADFDTLVKAIKAGDVALLEHELAATGETAAVLCTAVRVSSKVEYFPFAMLFTGNPYKVIQPPKSEGEFYPQQESQQ